MKISKIKKKRRSSRTACAMRQFNKTRNWSRPKTMSEELALFLARSKFFNGDLV